MAEKKISQRYRIIEELASGGQYRAYLGQDLLLRTQVVIKEVVCGDVETARHEFRVLSQLHHPNLVSVCGLVADQGQLYLVQTHAPGPDLVSWARQDLSLCRVSLVAGAAVRGLQYMHERGAVHRDIKPDNIRVGDGTLGSLPALRFVDFGLATFQPPAETTGTLGYMAPEVMEGLPASPASDLFALGAVLFEAFSGQPPGLLPGLLPDQPPGQQPGQPPGVQLVASRESLADTLRACSAIREAEKNHSQTMVELLLALLDSEPEHRPKARDLIEGLGEIVGRSLQLTAEELAGAYFPQPVLVGRDPQIKQLDQMIKEVGQGQTLLLQLVGGKARWAQRPVLWLTSVDSRCLRSRRQRCCRS